MRLSLLALLTVFALASTHCTARISHPPPRGPPPPPPPRGPPPMGYDEAVGLGMAECRRRSYLCELQEAHFAGKDRWKVKLQVAGGRYDGHLHLTYHAFTRELVELHEKVKDKDRDHPGRGHGRGHDKHHDDDGRPGRGDGHGGGKGHGDGKGKHRGHDHDD